MSVLFWLFTIFVLVGYIGAMLGLLLKILQKWLKISCFYINICYFCIVLLCGYIVFMLNLVYNNGRLGVWNVFAPIFGAILFNIMVFIVFKTFKKKN